MTEALTDLVGTDRGTSRWFETSQADVDTHAETVGDGGWIHNDVEQSATGPYGDTLLQGSLMISNLARMARDLEWPTVGILNRFHYGFDRVRFVHQVPTGSRIRGRFAVTGAIPKGDDGLDTLVTMSATIEAELPNGRIVTAVVAEMLAYFVAER